MKRRSPITTPLHVQGIDAELTHKDVKSLRLRIKPPDGKVAVSAPWHATHAEIARFVASNRAWILEAQERVRRAAPPPQPLVDGGRVRLWGQWHDLRVRHAPRATARLVDGVVEIAAPDEDGRSRAMEALYRREMLARLEPLHEHWAGAMGRAASAFRLRRMTSRWGTCQTRTAVITLNLALAERPVEALEYVLVHELAHLHVRGHGPLFHALMDRHLPDWKCRRAALRGRP